MGRGTFLGHLLPPNKSSTPGWEAFGSKLRGITPRKPHRHCTVGGRVPKVLGKGDELNNN